MKNIIEFSNIIKYEQNKCIQCEKCVYACENKALVLNNNEINFNKEKCIACKKCINICGVHALYYNVNDGLYEGSNAVGIIPYDVDSRLLTKKYDKIITYELGEKVKVIETAFEMEKMTSKKVNNELSGPLIVSDIDNFELVINSKKPNLNKYCSKIKNIYYISSYLERVLNKNKNIKISAYGISFGNKKYFENNKIIDEICDIPYKPSHKYNLLDVLNVYKALCKFESSYDLNQLDLSNNIIVNMWNKSVNINILFLREINYLYYIEIKKYDFIFVCDKELYVKNEDLLKDDEVNKLYKTKLIAPGKTTQLYKEN